MWEIEEYFLGESDGVLLHVWNSVGRRLCYLIVRPFFFFFFLGRMFLLPRKSVSVLKT